nr:Asp-tRNA(Asn)/Glu-tRNA(Gln) amidotransferase subunit GatB [Candidatus Deianiraea vastatrix]
MTSKKGNSYELVIGLEIHAQIKDECKVFSKSSTNWDAKPNTNISPMDIALPGALPVLNMNAVSKAIAAGMAINATINEESFFDRKNYFYPDLPSGYQITQFYKPIVENGWVDISLEDASKKRINIERIHIEQDAGKSIHDLVGDKTCLDYNRAGVGLMEIVSKPELSSPFEAGEYVKKLRSLIRAVGASDADMDEGSMRVDANVSVRLVGEKRLGTRCEIKNLNSVRYLQAAIEFEANRHIEIIENGGQIDQETRLFNVEKGETRSMRKKEDANDYKYFPDPDLPPLKLSTDFIDAIRKNLPELPEQKLTRYLEYGIIEKEAIIMSEDIGFSSYFDEVAKKSEPKMAYTWVMIELLGRLNKEQIKIEESKILPSHIIELISLITNGKINGKIAKTVLDEMFVKIMSNEVKTPSEIVKDLGLEQIDNTDEIIAAIKDILKNNPTQLQSFKNGNQKLFGFFVGEVMKVTKGKANPAKVNDLLKIEIDKA